MKNKSLVSIDIGTTNIKVVKYKHHEFYYEQYDRKEINDILERAIKKNYDVILLTGSGASMIEEEFYAFHDGNIPIIRYNELECVANIVKAEGFDEGLVVNIGTGTSFLYYHKGDYKHVTGTGIGGGTFEGLSERLLSITDPKEVEVLALDGDISKVNLVIKDIYTHQLGWLQEDITVANFAKTGTKREDVAMGIHSMVIEPIMSMAKAFCYFKNLDHIYFTGGVMNNKIIIQLVEKYAQFFNIHYKLLDKPSYGTARGALEAYWKENSQEMNMEENK
jgi:type II pantothenate kinase